MRGSAWAEARAKMLVQAARERGLQLEGDGRLAEVASWVALQLETDTDARPPPRRAIDFCVRHLGVVEPIPNVVTMMGGTDEDARRVIGDTLAKETNIVYNRFGLAAVTRSGQPITVIVLMSSKIDLDPVDRFAAPKSAISLHGSLVGNFRSVVALATPPNGRPLRVGESRGTKFDFQWTLGEPGAHQIELMANGDYGPEVVANFPVYVGSKPPEEIEVVATPLGSGEADAQAMQAEMFRLLNETRRAASLPPLTLDAALARLALAHSRDMADSNYFGHTSPVMGDVGVRAKKAGIFFPLITENLARGASAEDMHGALLESPGHRANMLNSKLTHVGIGVVLRGEGNFAEAFATEDFGAEATPLDPRTAPPAILEMLNRARQARGIPALVAEPTLERAARTAAERAAREGMTDETASAAAVAELKSTLPRSSLAHRVRFVRGVTAYLPSLEQTAGLPVALDAAAAYVGVAVIPREPTAQQASNVVFMFGCTR